MRFGFCVAKQYLPAPHHVVATLRLVVPAVNVHVRDPRRALISWIVHMQDRLDAGQIAEAWSFAECVLPDDYVCWSFAHRLEWHIDHVLPRLVAWTVAQGTGTASRASASRHRGTTAVAASMAAPLPAPKRPRPGRWVEGGRPRREARSEVRAFNRRVKASRRIAPSSECFRKLRLS
jgi:hypothetical protein